MKKVSFVAVAVFTLGMSSQIHAKQLRYSEMQELFGEPVTTSANGSPQRAADVPLDMTIITKEDIARFPATQIPDILRHYAGISVRQNTSSEYSVGIRGYNSPFAERILVLINGRQVFEDYYGLVNWATMPVQLNEIQQIEVIRGPNTALFGFNAASGVINIITLNPLYDDVSVVEGDIGVNGYRQGSAVFTTQLNDNFALRFSGSGRTNDEDENTTNAYTDLGMVDTSFNHSFNLDLAYQIDESTQARLEVSRATANENVFDTFFDNYARDSKFKSIHFNLTSDTEYGIIEATLYHNAIDVDYEYSPFDIYDYDNDVTVFRLSNTIKPNASHIFRLGGEFRQNHNVTGYNFEDIGTTKINIGSLMGLWNWQLNKDFSVNFASRYDHARSEYDGFILEDIGNPFTNLDYNNYHDEVGYNIGLVYKLTAHDTLRFAISKGIDFPSSDDLTFQDDGEVFGDPRIDPSEIHDFQIGYERRIDVIGGNFRTTAFYQYINEQQADVLDEFGVAFLQNAGDTKVHGIELGLNGITDNGIRWGANYSFSKIIDDLNPNIDIFYDDENSEHIVNVNLGYSPTTAWDMNLFGSYQSSFDQERFIVRDLDFTDFEYVLLNIEPDFIIDAVVSYKPIDKLTLSLNGRALLGDNEQSAYNEDVDRQLFIRAKYEF